MDLQKKYIFDLRQIETLILFMPNLLHHLVENNWPFNKKKFVNIGNKDVWIKYMYYIMFTELTDKVQHISYRYLYKLKTFVISVHCEL